MNPRELTVWLDERISREIWEEDRRARLERENDRRFAAFRIREDGVEACFRVEHGIDMFFAAKYLRRHLRSDTTKRFADTFTSRFDISRAEYDDIVAERQMNTGRVTGVFDIDMDSGTFTSLHVTDGWQTYRIKDVSMAVYFAALKSYASAEERQRTFLNRLDGKLLNRTDTPSPDWSQDQSM